MRAESEAQQTALDDIMNGLGEMAPDEAEAVEEQEQEEEWDEEAKEAAEEAQRREREEMAAELPQST